MVNKAIINLSLNILLLLFIAMPGGRVFAGETLVIGIHPYLAHDEIVKRFMPLATYLGDRAGLDIRLKVGSSYEEHIDAIGLDNVDIAYLGPASYITMTTKYGEKPMLAKLEVNGRSYFQGHIVVHENSDIHSLQDLKGKNIAFGDPNSTMSYIVPHYLLHQAGVFNEQHTRHQFLQSHTNVALSVLAGDFDAGAVKPAVCKQYEKEGLRTLAMTPKISEHLFVARKGLGKEKIRKIREAMLSMKDTQEGMAALKAIKSSITALVATSNEDYDNLRKIMDESHYFH